jgi:LmbE family N-acetylglucosaminyl deacetylase
MSPGLKPVAVAIAAHPDDIEFQMAGTLLLLEAAGFETHYINLCDGCRGSLTQNAAATRKTRAKEARQAAKILRARHHPPLARDLELSYDTQTLRRVAGLVREIRPRIVLTHSPQDYMEDHMIACRLAVTAAFAKGMPNFPTTPPRQSYQGDVAVYHCMPHGLRDGLRRRVVPGAFVNTAAVYETKLASLAAHQSQQQWLDASQGLNSYLAAMEAMSLELGKMSGQFRHAEGWRRHLHLGLSAHDDDPLAAALGRDFLPNSKYELELELGE